VNEYTQKLDDGNLDSLSDKPVYIAFESADDGSTVGYLFELNFEDASEGGAGPCRSIEEAVRKLKYHLGGFQKRNDVPQIGPGHVDLDDRTGEVEVEDVLPSSNLGDFL